MKIKNTCASCGEILRKADTYETIERPKGRKLCKKCFDKWLWDDLEERRALT